MFSLQLSTEFDYFVSGSDSYNLSPQMAILPNDFAKTAIPNPWINIPVPKCSPYPIPSPKPNPTHNFSLKSEGNER